MCLGLALSMLPPLPGEYWGEGDQDEDPSPPPSMMIANAALSPPSRAGDKENDGDLPLTPLFALGLIPQ